MEDIGEAEEERIREEIRQQQAVLTTFQRLEDLLRFLEGVEDRIDPNMIPQRPRNRLAKWIDKLDNGELAIEDWSQMNTDIDVVFEYIRDDVAGRSFDEFNSLSAAQQRLVALDGFISGTIHSIESIEGNSLQVALDAFNRDRKEHRAQSHATATSQAATKNDPPVVFIGYGHSPLWRELKDYLEDDLGLTARYFATGQQVGEHIVEFLKQAGAEADCAVILLTTDDEQKDGEMRARQNAVHEAGYFQGKLGFNRVAMVIQEEVERFSNVAGVTTLRFKDRHVRMTFADLRVWLIHQGLIK